jgi:hypothetical protein
MSSTLMLLESGAVDELPSEFARLGAVSPKPSFLTRPYRDTDLSNMDVLVRKATESGAGPDTDRWLAPRLHAALRLTRAEAADRRMWAYLGVVKYPEYVRARFGQTDAGAPLDRFAGPDSKQALARLWWTAELTRNGPGYADVQLALTPQEVPNTGLKLRCFRHRPTAISLARLCATGAEGQPLHGRDINALFKRVNLRLSTTVLHAIATDPGPDGAAIDLWVATAAQPIEGLLANPTGPNDAGVSIEAIAAATEFIASVGHSMGLFASS